MAANNKKTKITQSRLFLQGKSLFQRVLITIQFFDKKGLSNHAAAGAYGFLLSAAPTLLLVSIFMLITFRSSPQTVSGLIQRDIPFLETIFDESWVTQNIIKISKSGIPGIFSIISLIWAGRIFALSLQRGLTVIFSGKKTRSPVNRASPARYAADATIQRPTAAFRGKPRGIKPQVLALVNTIASFIRSYPRKHGRNLSPFVNKNLITLLIQLVVVTVVLGLIISSQAAVYFHNNINFLPKILVDIFVILRSHIFPFAILGLISFCAYRIIPANAPRTISAVQGALFCIIPYGLIFSALKFIINKTRYNFLYGALGDLIILLVGVYFFFIFFFMGAQFAKVIDSLDVLLFSNLLKARNDSIKKRKGLWQKIFFSPNGPLSKYLRYYQKDDIIFLKGGKDNDIYYLLDGQVEVFFHTIYTSESPAAILEAGTFFGEMGYLLSENRNATVKAKTSIAALVIPPRLFDEVLNNDISIDRAVIENLTQRLKAANLRNPEQ